MAVVSVIAEGRPHPSVADADDVAAAIERNSRTLARVVSAPVALAAVSVLLLAAPFERIEPLLRLPGQSVSAVESVLIVGALAWMAALARDVRAPRWRTALTLPWVAWLVVAVAASLLSPISMRNAVHMTARLALAFIVFLLTRSAAVVPRGRDLTLAALTCSAVAASALVVLEFLAVPQVLEFLRGFRPSVSVVGTAIRAGGPLQYPQLIASMYLEIAFACALGLLVDTMDRRRWGIAAALLAGLVIIGEGIVLTFTRAGLLTALISLAIVGAVRVHARGWDRAAVVIAAIAAVFVVQVTASHSLELLRLRLTTEGQNAWFRASIAAPAALDLRTGSQARIPIEVANTGRVTWEPVSANPVRVSYHWIDASSGRVAVWEGARTELPGPVTSGRSVRLDAVVQAPPIPGAYELVWDIEQVHRLWFSTEPGAQLATTRAEVTGPIVGALPRPRIPFLPRADARPGRLVLWRAAAQMVSQHPLLGVGPDNFRLQYGETAGIHNADPRVHSNSMYVEVLAGTGIAGAGAFTWLVWRVRRVAVQALTTDVRLKADATKTSSPTAAGLVAAVIAIALHGLIDTFLGFTATYVLIAVVLGLVTSAAETAEPHAHRV